MQLCVRLHALPCAGGLLDQPWGFMLTMKVLVAYAKDYDTFERLGNDAPNHVRSRVLAVAARSVRLEN